MTGVSDTTIEGPHGLVPVRIYLPDALAGPGLVWLHGGGFAFGDLDMPEADATARSFADRGIAVVSVDYRLAPVSPALAEWTGGAAREGVHAPVASEEAVAAFRWAVASDLAPGPWALGGASAGGNLATGATLRLLHGDGPVPALVVLVYPTLHAVQDAPDAALRAALDADPAADVFGPEVVANMYAGYLGEADPDVFAVPGLAEPGDLAGFPPTMMVNDEVDELRVSGEAFARTLATAGVEIDVSIEPGTVHGHLNTPGPAATATIDRFAARLLAVRRRPDRRG